MDLTALMNFLDIHSGTIIAIATIALVAATSYTVYFNQKLWLAQDIPLLHFYVKLGRDTNDRLFIKNIGKGAALDVKFTVKHGGRPEVDIDGLVLAPREEYKILDLSPDNVEKYEIDEITYFDVNKRTINQEKIVAFAKNFTTYTDTDTNNKLKV
jgi:hypothetical protein